MLSKHSHKICLPPLETCIYGSKPPDASKYGLCYRLAKDWLVVLDHRTNTWMPGTGRSFSCGMKRINRWNYLRASEGRTPSKLCRVGYSRSRVGSAFFLSLSPT